MADPVVLGDRYELGDVIGRGGMAEVRRARDIRLGRDVAIKLLRSDLAGDPTFQARFAREAQSSAGLNQPTIVSVYDTGTTPDPNHEGVQIPYIVMELVEGHTLREILRDGRRILPERALELTCGVLDALAYSHKAGIIHRDIKPANVMLTKSGGVKVMDFGIARAVADTSATMTQTAAVIGTAQYLSPEQARGETVGTRSDIYSAGCLLYELLTSRPPFQGDSPVSVAYQHVREVPVPPSQVDPDDTLITPAMDAIVLKALAKDPADRYQDADAMKNDIQRLLAGQEVTAVVPAAFSDAPTMAMAPVTDARTTIVKPVPASLPTPAEVDPEPAVIPGLVAVSEVEADVPPRERRGTNPFMAALLTLLLAALVAGGVFAYFQVRDAKKTPVVAQVAVPAVVNFTEAQAKTMIDAKGLVTAVKYETGAAATEGQVTKQDPAANTMVNPASTVTITVNGGPEMVQVPTGLVGKQLTEVQPTLEKAGFKVNVVKATATNEPATAKSGDVVAVDPAQGAQVAKGSTVNVTVAQGLAQVPNLRGKTIADARKELVTRGFSADRIKVSPATAADTDTVADQSAEGELNKTSEITLVAGKKTVAVPNVVGLAEADAVAKLTAAELAHTSTLRTDATVPAGSVISQSVAAGTEVTTGSMVGIVVSSGPPSPAPTTSAAPTPAPTPSATA